MTPTIRINYGSFVTPDSVYDYDLTTGKLILLKTTPVLDEPTFGPYNPARYVQERAWATAADGVASAALDRSPFRCRPGR